MRAALLVAATLAAGCHVRAPGVQRHPLVFYVAPDGRDDWSGTLPAHAGADGPFASLERARDAIRTVRREHGLPPDGVVVELRGGVYSRTVPFELAAIDSGTAASPIIYRAAAGETVVIDGGRAVDTFGPVADPAILARLPAEARGHVVEADLRALSIDDFGPVGSGGLELFGDGRPMTLARWPNRGFVTIGELTGDEPLEIRGIVGNKVGAFRYEGERPARWLAEPQPWLHGYFFWDWSDMREPIAHIDPASHVIALAPPYHQYGYRKGQWYYAFNLLAELDEPGEWYLDRATGRLYWWRPDADAHARVSIASQLVTLDGVDHIELHGLTFSTVRGTAIAIHGGSHDVVAGCTVRATGGWAVTIDGASESGVADSVIEDTGLGGISLSGGDRKTLTPGHDFVTGTQLHDLARWKRTLTPAIDVHGVGQVVAHNRIERLPHEAIAFAGNDHVIEANEIGHVCEETIDAGAIYAGRDWTMRGTVIRNNFLHDINGLDGRGANGVYLDDELSGTTVSNNIFVDVSLAVFVGGGRDNVVSRNIFDHCATAVRVDARGLGWAASTNDASMIPPLTAMPYRSAAWAARYPRLPSILDDDPAAPKGNRIFENILGEHVLDNVEANAKPFVTTERNLMAASTAP